MEQITWDASDVHILYDEMITDRDSEEGSLSHVCGDQVYIDSPCPPAVTEQDTRALFILQILGERPPSSHSGKES